MRVAYVTLATNERYLKGAYNLYKSFLNIGSKYEFVVMTFSDTNLENYNDLPTRIIPKIYPTNKRFEYNPPIGMFSKLCLFLLEEYDFLLFLDCDILLYKNIDYLIDDCIENYENKVQIPFVPNPNNAHDVFSSAWIFTKPNKQLFLKSTKYFDYSINDQEVLTYMYDAGDLPTTNYKMKEFIDNTFHFNNWFPNQKYWENLTTLKVYDIINKNSELIPLFKEIQKMIATQPYETNLIE